MPISKHDDIVIKFGGRRTGRSTDMIDWLIDGEPDSKRVVICHSAIEAQRLYKRAKIICATVEDWQFISHDQMANLRGRKVSEAGIDNLEIFLHYTTGLPVRFVTGTLAEDHRYGHQRGFAVQINTISGFPDHLRV